MGEPAPARTTTSLVLAFAMTFPTLVAWLYFVVLGGAGQANPVQQFTYVAGKVIQFSVPVLFLVFVVRRRPTWQGSTTSGLVLGIGFGVLVAGALLAAYFGGLRSSSLLAATPGRIREKMEQMGTASFGGYVALAVFLCVFHSFLEEYYWRWFVFGQLRLFLPLVPALVLASAGFMAHHVVILWVYLPGKVLTGVVPASLAVAVGGAMWAWIYERGGSLVAPWLSHTIIDAALFVIGWDLLRRGLET